MIPITTIVAFDIGALIGGAIITETVFGWSGMGKLFNDALHLVDVNTLMGVFLVVGIFADRRQHPRRPRVLGARPSDPGDRMTNPFSPLPPVSPEGDDRDRAVLDDTTIFDDIDIPDAVEETPTERAENAIELKEVEGLSQGRIVWRRFLRHRGALISMIVLLFIILLAFTSDGHRRARTSTSPAGGITAGTRSAPS